MPTPKVCSHLQNFSPKFQPKAYECEECVKTGDRWVHLRTCQVCGTTLCCDSSPNQHATKHYQAHKEHHLIISAEPEEKWAWCYVDEDFMRY
jgi:hypothetical protein